jgi:hypothetical protein
MISFSGIIRLAAGSGGVRTLDFYVPNDTKPSGRRDLRPALSLVGAQPQFSGAHQLPMPTWAPCSMRVSCRLTDLGTSTQTHHHNPPWSTS